MKLKLKRLDQQVMVITGASSGIGLVTARKAAKAGARLVLTARSNEALEKLAHELNSLNTDVICVQADVSKEEDVQRIGEQAIRYFNGFDTWVNNAGITIYGNLLDVTIKDMRQLFETNFWGVVHGSLVAARHLKSKGGALINIGSTLSDRAIPLQGIYCASKHAVKGFTDSLRMELEAENAPVSVTLVKPSGIDTPYTRHAKNYLPVEPKNPPPVYAPEVVADVILHCATHPERDMFAGAGAKALSVMGYYAPRLSDKAMERFTIAQQKSDRPARHDEPDGLYSASSHLEERGGYEGHVAESSLYTKATLHPFVSAAIAVGAGVAVGSLLSNGHGRNLLKKSK